MQKFLKVCAAVCGSVLFVGFGVQTVLGILWMCSALAGAQSFGEGVVCVGQIVLLAAAVLFFAGKVRGKIREKIFLVCAVLTFPMVMQCLVIPDVRTLTTALFLVQTGCVLRNVGDLEERKFFYAGLGVWVAAALIRGEYLYLGAVPAVAGAAYQLFAAGSRCKANSGDEAARAAKRRMRLRILSLAAAAGIAVGIGSFYQERTHITTHLVSRVAWTSLYHSYWELPKRDRWMIDPDELIYSSFEAAGIEKNLLPFLVEAKGEQETRRLFVVLSKVAWTYGKGRILKEIGWDLAGYALAPVILPLQLRGRGYDSYSGINYFQMIRTTQHLGKLYIHYGFWWFQIAAVCAPGAWIAAGAGLRSLKKQVIPLLAGIAMCVWYTMRGAGQMDYKNTTFLLCVWLLGMASAAVRGWKTGGQPDE